MVNVLECSQLIAAMPAHWRAAYEAAYSEPVAPRTGGVGGRTVGMGAVLGEGDALWARQVARAREWPCAVRAAARRRLEHARRHSHRYAFGVGTRAVPVATVHKHALEYAKRTCPQRSKAEQGLTSFTHVTLANWIDARACAVHI